MSRITQAKEIAVGVATTEYMKGMPCFARGIGTNDEEDEGVQFLTWLGQHCLNNYADSEDWEVTGFDTSDPRLAWCLNAQQKIVTVFIMLSNENGHMFVVDHNMTAELENDNILMAKLEKVAKKVEWYSVGKVGATTMPIEWANEFMRKSKNNEIN